MAGPESVASGCRHASVAAVEKSSHGKTVGSANDAAPPLQTWRGLGLGLGFGASVRVRIMIRQRVWR